MASTLKKEPRIVFLFSTSRERTMAEVQSGECTDTALRGWNHIPGAECITIGECSIFSIFFRLLRYDFVVAQDELLLGYLVSRYARLLGHKTQWVYITMTSSTLIRRHATHPVRLFLLKQFWSSYARIICLSSEQLKDLARLGVPREQLVFVPFGVDTTFFQPIETSREEALIVSLGRDSGRDYPTLFRAVEGTDRACIVVAAPRNIPVTPPFNVTIFYGRSYGESRDLYARARLVVIPSKDMSIPDGSDCSGQTVIMEALAAGKAVIATYRPWIKDYFVAGEDLLVVPPNDPTALAQAIDSLWQDGEKRKRLAESGRAKVTSRYTTKTFAAALRALVASLV